MYSFYQIIGKTSSVLNVKKLKRTSANRQMSFLKSR